MTTTETHGITADDIVQAVKELAKTYPDFIYDPGYRRDAVEAISFREKPCSNLEGGCDKYPSMPGCIAGQAFRRLGVDIDEDHSYRSVTALLGSYTSFVEDRDYLQRNWLQTVQSSQDLQMPWEDAVNRAQDKYPGV